MRHFITFGWLGLLLGLMACKTGKSVKTTQKGNTEKNIISITRKEDFSKPDVSGTAANFTIESMSLKDDIATLVVNYSGGCATHTFKAYFNGMFMKSMPPRATVFLEHDNGGDNCRKLVIDTLYVDLKEVRYNKESAGTVIVGFNGTDQVLQYKHK